MRETWKPVVGFEDAYEVSNYGRVRSMDRIVINQRHDGPMPRKFKGKMLRPGASLKSGHLSVSLGRYNSRLVHHLVLEAFVGPCPDGYEGRHLNDEPSHNVLSNLRWGTRSQNLHDAVRNGKKATGEATSNAKLTEIAVRFIRRNVKTQRIRHMARRFGVSDMAIIQVIKNITWRHVK